MLAKSCGAILISKEIEQDSGILPPQTHILRLPNNKLLENGKKMGMTQGEYNQITHFNIEKGQ